MPSVDITVTNAGRAAIVNAQHNGTAPVTITQVGLSQTAITPAATATTLSGEFKRVSLLSGEVVAADIIHVTMNDDSADAYTLRSFGLYLADGTLFALYSQSGAILNKAAASIGALSIDVVLADISAAAIAFGNANFTNPPATTERQGVVELATVAEAQAATDSLRALTPAAAKAAILGWLLTLDGAGSGLDADLLDGQQGSYYTNIAARLGYTPVNRAGDTMTGALTLPGNPANALQAVPKQYVDGLVTAAALLAKILTVDGAGSGLDADLLDGQDGAYYANIAARLGYTPVNKAGDTFTGAVALETPAPRILFSETDTGKKWHAVLDGSSFSLREDDTSNANIKFSVAPGSLRLSLGTTLVWGGDTVWHTGNDGSGSGLDADLLDGQQGSYYTDIVARLGYTPLNLAGDVARGRILVKGNGAGDSAMATATTNLGEIEVQGNGTGAAMLAFHRPNNRAVYFGLDTDNQLKLGGWSLGATAYTMWHSGNDGSGSGLDADLLDGEHASAFARTDGTTTFTGRLLVQSSSQACFKPATGENATVIHRNDGTNYNILLTPPSTEISQTSNSLRPLRIEVATGLLASANGQDFAGGMKVAGGLTLSGNADLYSTSGNAYLNSQLLWHAGNDGAGSGLDAGLLAGQAPDYYTNIVARLGYTPANRAGDTFTGPISRDAGFYLNLQNGNPLINFAPNDYLVYNRTADGLNLFINGVNCATFGGDGWLAMQSGIAVGGSNVWHAGNDGSGSGLDADLLDGQQGSYYTNITARLGYTPINKAGDEVTAAIAFKTVENAAIAARPQSRTPLHVVGNGTGPALATFERPNAYAGFLGIDTDNRWKVGGWSMAGAFDLWHSGNDGSGSGLDADMLDGKDWTSGQDVRFGMVDGTTPNSGTTGGLRLRGNASSGLAHIQITNSDAATQWGYWRHSADGRADWNGSAGLMRSGNKVWDAANDGSGSGLDADLLDGWHLNDILPSGNLDSTGYCRLPNGLILQWGMVYCAADSYGSITFPIQFPAACFHIHSGVATELGNGNAQANCPLPYSVTKDGASFWNAAPAANAWWMALGK